MTNIIRELTRGGCLSRLRESCGNALIEYLLERELLAPCNEKSEFIVKDHQTLSVSEDNSESRFYAEGFLDGVWQRLPVPATDLTIYRLNLQHFTMEVLDLRSLGITHNQFVPLRDGCGAYKLGHCTSLNTFLYLSLSNSTTEFRLIEDRCEEFSKKIVVIAPERRAPATHASVIGNIQYIALSSIFNAAQPDQSLPLTYFMESSKAKTVPPYVVLPGLKVGVVAWEDITLEFDAKDSIHISTGGKKKRTYLRAQVHFMREANNTPNHITKQAALLLIIAGIEKLPFFKDRALSRLLERLDRDMKVFFRQSEHFYTKDEDGGIRPRLTLRLDRDLQERFEALLERVQSLSSGGLWDADLVSRFTDWDAFNAVRNKAPRH